MAVIVAKNHGLHRQGGAYLESAYYRELMAPLDVRWIFDAMVGAAVLSRFFRLPANAAKISPVHASS